jgi:type IV pilus assembly protein PilB
MEEIQAIYPTKLPISLPSRSALVIVDNLIQLAYEKQASDIHLDPRAHALMVRFRINGSLQTVESLPNEVRNEILARLKILAGLRTDEHQLPQDGRFRFEISQDRLIDVRVSIAPTYYGENAVLRILSASSSLSSLTSLGFNRSHQEILQTAIHRPHGMILITGPTGNGKTSTLYTLLQLRNTETISIVTIEDPIEYAIDGINQIPISKSNNFASSLTFANGLRSVLRQDPNIIGIGEIRDADTATLATHAALTGHLVLSTLHTTDAPTALPRLMDLGIEPYLISSTVSVVISQRLVRRLCQDCKRKKPLRKDQKALIALILGPKLTCHEQYESAGCETCSGTGISGRIGIFEILKMNTEIREAVMHKVSARKIYSLALENGMIPLLHDGIRKAAEGTVNLDEVLALLSE